MYEREEINLTYYSNSDDVISKTIKSGKFIHNPGIHKKIIQNNIDNNLFDDLWIHQYKDDFLFIEKIKNKYINYCKKYSNQLRIIIEIQITQKTKNIYTNEQLINICTKLYSLNISIINLLTYKTVDKGFGGSNDIKHICDLEDEIDYLAHCALEVPINKSMSAGFYDVILDPEATGLFVHEIVGHCFEADNNIISDSITQKKEKLSIDQVTIVDNPLLTDGYGSYEYDDEGNKAQKTYLVLNGYAHSLLHSNSSAQMLKTKSTGNGRAISYQYEPIVRMSNTYMLPSQQNKKSDLFNSTQYGIYFKGCRDSRGGKDFVLNFRESFLILDGKITDRINDMMLLGNIFRTLSRISLVADDLVINGGGTGGCGKKGQWPLEVSAGGPHVKITNMFLMPSSISKKDVNINLRRKFETNQK